MPHKQPAAKKRIFRFLTQGPWFEAWRYSQEAQYGYLAQSAQLEEAGNPRLVNLTLMITSSFVLAFLIWAALAHISEVTRAPGEVVPQGMERTVQHLEGGILRALLVKEGDIVEKGQPLLRMDVIGIEEDLARARLKQQVLTLQRERLLAFIEGRDARFNDFENIEKAIVVEQNAIYQTMMEARESEREVIRKQVGQKQQDIRILNAKISTADDRVQLLEEQYTGRKKLHDEGYFPRARLLEVQERLVAARGEKRQLESQLMQARAAMAEFQEKLNAHHTGGKDSAYQQLESIQADLAQNAELITKLEAQNSRMIVRAPVDGIVKGLSLNTVGGVIQPGQVLMDIVPLNEPLIAEISISPQDIGHVSLGQPVRLKISAYDFSQYGVLEGNLSALSATTFEGANGARFYKGRVALQKQYLGNSERPYPISPGMTLMADIITGERTVLTYLLKPIQKSFEKAFHEK